ncbi:MAG: diaminohydroxyphosphoribosylaminopyrimidine reductase [Thermoplasmatales archaeon]|nr:diaminohydroxyphosphoribosylaminopyrimidine reductase [Thermoplasmatales archaeon]
MRPFVHVNCAMSADGRIAGVERTQIRISSKEDMDRVKALRAGYGSIAVGVGTVISDDPHLTVKGLGRDENPVRVVIDPNGRTPDGALVLDGRARTVIATSSSCAREWAGAETVRCGDPFDLSSALRELGGMGIESMLVEGGGRTIWHFFDSGFVDRFTVFVGGVVIGGTGAPTPADGPGWVAGNGVEMDLVAAETLGNGALLTFEGIRKARG